MDLFPWPAFDAFHGLEATPKNHAEENQRWKSMWRSSYEQAHGVANVEKCTYASAPSGSRPWNFMLTAICIPINEAWDR